MVHLHHSAGRVCWRGSGRLFRALGIPGIYAFSLQIGGRICGFPGARRQRTQQQFLHGVIERNEELREHIHSNQAVNIPEPVAGVQYFDDAILELQLADTDGICISGISRLIALIADAANLCLRKRA